uniref:Uncharacterized protein n=1 Tax=Rousettus aegyptiacus TaxID=9407 RepID=A0A7J8DI31_ROUAE|nr:hypothetical protein HJG63_008526 [Rousettus aegyptiacus]
MTFEREASVKDFPWISFTSFRFKQNGAGSTESSHIRLMHVRSASDHLTLCFMPCRSPGVILKILEIPWGRRCGLHSPSWLSLSLALFLGPAGSESKLGPFHGFHQDQKALFLSASCDRTGRLQQFSQYTRRLTTPLQKLGHRAWLGSWLINIAFARKTGSF